MKLIDLTEAKPPLLKTDEPVKLIKEHCTRALANARSKRFLYRGLKNLDGNFFIGTGHFVRANEIKAARLYNLLDSMPAWASLPKRQHSYICSTNRHEAERYAATHSEDGAMYIVFPFDNAKVAACSVDDFDRAFVSSFKSHTGLTVSITTLIMSLGTIGKLLDPAFNESSLSDIEAFLKTISQNRMLKIDVQAVPASKKNAVKIFSSLLKSTGSKNAFDALNTVMAPKSNGISDKIDFSGNHEVWFQGECVALKIPKSVGGLSVDVKVRLEELGIDPLDLE